MLNLLGNTFTQYTIKWLFKKYLQVLHWSLLPPHDQNVNLHGEIIWPFSWMKTAIVTGIADNRNKNRIKRVDTDVRRSSKIHCNSVETAKKYYM